MADSIWTSAMKEHIKHARARLVVKLGESNMTVGDLLTLQIGDIIPLDQEASGEVSIAVEGVEKIKCLIGVHKGNRAVQVTEVNRSKVFNEDVLKKKSDD